MEGPSRWVPRHRAQEKRRELSSMFRCCSQVKYDERKTLVGLGNLFRVIEERVVENTGLLLELGQ